MSWLGRLVLWSTCLAATWAVPVPSAAAAVGILFSSDWTGHFEVYAVDPLRPSVVRQVTFGSTPGCGGRMTACGAVDAVPSPNGMQVLYRQNTGCENVLWVTRRGGGAPIRLGALRRLCRLLPVAPEAAWSPDSTKIGYVGPDGLHVVRFDGAQNLTVSPRFFSYVTWAPTSKSLLATSSDGTFRVRGTRVTQVPPSPVIARSPNGRWVAFFDYRHALVVERADRRRSWLTTSADSTHHAWSPDSRRLAYVQADGLWVLDVKTGRTRRLTTEIAPDRYSQDRRAFGFVWAPDGRSIFYIAGRFGIWDVASGPMRSVSMTGHVRTVVGADAPYAGRILSIASVRNGRRLPLLRPELPPERVGRESVLADGPIKQIAVDGDHVAFSACLRTFVWTRPSFGSPGYGTGTLQQLDGFGGGAPRTCNWEDRSYVYSLALDGDRLASAFRAGCTGVLDLRLASLTSSERNVFDHSNVTCATAMNPALDDLEGEEGLLVYSSAVETQSCCPSGAITTVAQTIRRVGPTGCPCPVIASSSGPLVPADVSQGRILAYGQNETWLLDREGNRLWTLPVGPAGAQLSGDDLVLLLRAQLQVYDTRARRLQRTIPLPDVPSSGHECELRCTSRGQLVLEDVGHRRALYLLDRQLHVVDLFGRGDTVIASATMARFTKDGLVYADGSRIFFLPTSAIP